MLRNTSSLTRFSWRMSSTTLLRMWQRWNNTRYSGLNLRFNFMIGYNDQMAIKLTEMDTESRCETVAIQMAIAILFSTAMANKALCTSEWVHLHYDLVLVYDSNFECFITFDVVVLEAFMYLLPHMCVCMYICVCTKGLPIWINILYCIGWLHHFFGFIHVILF